jgi:putative endonuclease
MQASPRATGSVPARAASTTARGRAGEDLACAILAEKGIELIERNFRTPGGEVDIIGREHDVLCFVEVKSWGRAFWPDLSMAIGPRKRGRIRKTAVAWLARDRRRESCRQVRFDLLLIDPDTGAHEWLPGALDW